MEESVAKLGIIEVSVGKLQKYFVSCPVARQTLAFPQKKQNKKVFSVCDCKGLSRAACGT